MAMGCEKKADFPLAADRVQAMVRFESGSDAGQRIAGVAAAARILRELDIAGARSVWLATGDGAALSAQAREDIERLAPRLELREVADTRLAGAHAGESGIAILSGDHLIPARALRPLLRDGAAPIAHDGATVAVRLPSGASLGGAPLGAPAAGGQEPAGILPLVPPARASAAILKATGKDSDGLVSRWINRPISRRMTSVLLHVGWLRPIHMTWCTALIGVAMIASLLFGGKSGLVVGAWLLQASSVVDGVDGEMARATFRSSERGASLDTAVDMITNLAFVFGMTVNLGLHRASHHAAVGGFALGELAVGLAIIYLLNRRRGGPVNFDLLKLYYGEKFGTALPHRITRALTIATSRDFLVMLVLVMIAFGRATWIPYAGAVTATIWLFFVVIAVPVLWPEREAQPVSD